MPDARSGYHPSGRAQLLGRHVHHPIVTRLQEDSDGGAADFGALVDRVHVRFHQPDAAHRLVGGHAEARQFLDGGLLRLTTPSGFIA